MKRLWYSCRRIWHKGKGERDWRKSLHWVRKRLSYKILVHVGVRSPKTSGREGLIHFVSQTEGADSASC